MPIFTKTRGRIPRNKPSHAVSAPYIAIGTIGALARVDKYTAPFFALRDGLYSVALLSSPSNRCVEFMMPFVVGLLTATPDQVIKQLIYSKDICIKDCLRANLTFKSFGMPGPIMRAVVVGLSVNLAKEINRFLTKSSTENAELN